MTSFELFALKNRMLIYNLFTTQIGVWIIIILSIRSISPPFYEVADFAHGVNLIFIPLQFLLILILQLYYERPIRYYINSRYLNRTATEDLKEKVKRRLLNAPFFIIALDLSLWIQVFCY